MTHEFHFYKTLLVHDIGMDKRLERMSNTPCASTWFGVSIQMHETSRYKSFPGNKLREVLCFIR